MIRARSRLEAPSAMSDRISRSIDTVGSPDSIFATLDWLDCTAIAKSCCVSRFRTRRALSPSASLRRSSISAASSGDRFRNSLASPSFQPRFASLALLLARIVILLKTSLAVRDHVPGRGARLLGKHRPYHNRVSVRPINDSPIGRLGVIVPTLVRILAIVLMGAVVACGANSSEPRSEDLARLRYWQASDFKSYDWCAVDSFALCEKPKLPVRRLRVNTDKPDPSCPDTDLTAVAGHAPDSDVYALVDSVRGYFPSAAVKTVVIAGRTAQVWADITCGRPVGGTTVALSLAKDDRMVWFLKRSVIGSS